MSTAVVLPALGESVTEGTVTRWLKNVGDRVEVDEGLVEISTDKVDTEIPSPVAGILEEILVAEDETVEVGALLARVGDGSSAPAPSEASGTSAAPAAPESAAPAAEEAALSTTPAPPEQAAEPTVVSTSPVSPAASSEAAAPSTARPTTTGDLRDVRLPELGESVTEGTVTRWLKNVGDTVAVDDPLLEISTDKVDTEIPSPYAGVLREILVAEDETVEIGAVLARIGDQAAEARTAPEAPSTDKPVAVEDAEAHEIAAARDRDVATPPSPPAPPSSAPAPAQASHAGPARPTDTTTAAQPAVAGDDDGGHYVTPLVRRLAQQHGVDLSTVTGTGIGGRIRKEDVLRAAQPKPEPTPASAAPTVSAPAPISPLRGTTQPMSRLRRVLAERAVESMQATAQLTTVVEVDVTDLAGYRQQVKDDFATRTGTKLSFLPFFARAAAEALRTYPVINATVDGNSIVYPPQENLSIAVDTDRGLLTPVVRDAADKSIAQLAVDIADLAARTRENKLKPDELAGGTFTLTNTGSRGALFDTPVVFLPQSAILGTGSVVRRPGVVTAGGADAVAIRSYVYLALSYDHRIIDGADAARYLTAVKERLERADFASDLGI